MCPCNDVGGSGPSAITARECHLHHCRDTWHGVYCLAKRLLLLFSHLPLTFLCTIWTNGILTSAAYRWCWPIAERWLLGDTWTLPAQCCWWGVVFSKKAFQHSGTQQLFNLSTEASNFFRLFLVIIAKEQMMHHGNTYTCPMYCCAQYTNRRCTHHKEIASPHHASWLFHGAMHFTNKHF